MEARTFMELYSRICLKASGCDGCPIHDACMNNRPYMDTKMVLVEAVEKWAEEHPDALFEQVGDGIYLDPYHRIIADEAVRVYTLEFTVIDDGGEARDMKGAGDLLARNVKNVFGADDVRCIRAQQLITKCHEEEV